MQKCLKMIIKFKIGAPLFLFNIILYLNVLTINYADILKGIIGIKVIVSNNSTIYKTIFSKN